MKIADNISWKKLQDKVVAVNLTTGTYYTMNSLASEIWTLLADIRTPAEIADIITTEYDATPEIILADLNSQIDYWKKEGLITE